jgi:hypothetical protein
MFFRVKVVFIMARIHPGEAPASFVIQVRVFLVCTDFWNITRRYSKNVLCSSVDQLFPIISIFQGLVDFLVSSHEVAQALRQNLQLSKPLKYSCAADFSLLNLPKGKSLGRSKPATNS